MAKIKLRLHPPSAAPSTHASPSDTDVSPGGSPRASVSADPQPSPAHAPAPGADPDLESEEANELEDEDPPLPPPPPSKPARKKKRVSAAASAASASAVSAGADDLAAGSFDDLPPAKRRKAHLKAGNTGPGRGWRKGLKLGQKPPYVPPSATASPRAEGQDTLPSSRPVSPAPLAAASAATAPRASAGAGAGKRAGRAAIPLSAAPVKPPPKLTIGFAPGGPLTKRDLTTRARRWMAGVRMVPTLGGGAMVVPTYWAGPDRDFDPHARAQAALAEARATNNVKAVIEVPGAVVRGPPRGIGTALDQRAGRCEFRGAGGQVLATPLRDEASASPAPDAKRSAGPPTRKPPSSLVAATAELAPSPVPSSPAPELDNWRGSSPAYVFAATEA